MAKTPRAFVKWVGGKAQIVDVLCELAPSSFEQYWEPFSGGASMFFALVRRGRISAACLTDLNEQLMISTWTLVERVDDVIALLKSPIFENSEENYKSVRAWDRDPDWPLILKDSDLWPFVTARVIYLTRLAWRGVWRENSKGYHNAPYWKAYAHKVNVLDERNLRAVSKVLKGIQIGTASFEYLQTANWHFLAQIQNPPCPTDFFYFDPPYIERFTEYTSKGFDRDDLERLRVVTDDLTHLGAYVMISMADIPAVYEVFQGYLIYRIRTDCKINRDPKQRKNGMNEVIILNYDPDTNEIFEWEDIGIPISSLTYGVDD